jgi:palmitoyl-protein thioesterase
MCVGSNSSGSVGGRSEAGQRPWSQFPLSFTGSRVGSNIGSNIVGRAGIAALGGVGIASIARKSRPRPVVLVHGVLDTAENMEVAANWVRQALGPRAYVRCVEVGNGAMDSLTRSMDWQLEQLAAQLRADVRLRGGINMIGYSQGSLLARAFLQRYAEPRVHTLIRSTLCLQLRLKVT